MGARPSPADSQPHSPRARLKILWSFCHVLRDDGLSYQDYLEDSASLPDPHILVLVLAEDLRSALEQIEDVLGDLKITTPRRQGLNKAAGAGVTKTISSILRSWVWGGTKSAPPGMALVFIAVRLRRGSHLAEAAT